MRAKKLGKTNNSQMDTNIDKKKRKTQNKMNRCRNKTYQQEK